MTESECFAFVRCAAAVKRFRICFYDIIVLGVIALCLFFSVLHMIKKRKKGKCGLCSSCAACGLCSDKHKEEGSLR